MISKSQTGFDSVVLLSLLLVLFESGVVEFTMTMFVLFPSVMTWVNRVIETVLPASKSPIVQITLFPSSLQFSGTSTNLTPSGNVSTATTSRAMSGPLFTTTMVHSTKSVTLTSVALTSLITSKSQIGLTSVVLFALLLDSFESGVVLFATTMLVLMPSVRTFVINTRVSEAFISISPTVQMPFS